MYKNKNKELNMKTMKMNDEVVRIEENEVVGFIKKGWKFCSKTEYKLKHGKGKANTPKVVTEKKEKKSKFNKKQQAEYEASKKAE
jgi:hypothetical protein